MWSWCQRKRTHTARLTRIRTMSRQRSIFAAGVKAALAFSIISHMPACPATLEEAREVGSIGRKGRELKVKNLAWMFQLGKGGDDYLIWIVPEFRFAAWDLKIKDPWPVKVGRSWMVGPILISRFNHGDKQRIIDYAKRREDER